MDAGDGICTTCDDNDTQVVWSTDSSDGDVTTVSDSAEGVGSDEDSTASDDPGDDTSSSRSADNRATDGKAKDESSDIATDSPSTDSGAASHIIDPPWPSDIDTSNLETSTDTADREGSSVDSAEGGKSQLDQKIDSWKEQLLDLTRRNNLVDFSVTKTKSLPFYRVNPLTVAGQLFENGSIFVHKSATEENGGTPADPAEIGTDEVAAIRSQEETANSLRNLRLKQKRFQREKGVNSLFIALGTLRWFDVDHSDSELRTPLFLIEVDLVEEANRDADRHDYEIQLGDGNVQINPALRKMLLSERGIELPPNADLQLDDLETAFAYIEEVIAGHERWHVAPEVILGIFDFSNFSLYTDLETNRGAVKNDAFVKAINGDPSALPEPPDSPTADQLDESVDPADIYQVLDADSSQQEAIEAAKRGMSFVLQGPPGTGKSQTIANIIAEKMAAGETVLFVSEKQAALDVVQSRLDDVDLGRFCLEAHGEAAKKTDILEDLERELQSEPLAKPAERDEITTKLSEIRSRLNEYQDRLFYAPPGQSTTAYDAFGIISKRDDCPRVALGIDDPTDFTDDQVTEFIHDLQSLADYDAQLEADGNHPWQHTTLRAWKINTRDRVADTLNDLIVAIEALREVQDYIGKIGGSSPSTPAEFEAANEFLSLLSDRPDLPISEEHLSPSFYAATDAVKEFETIVTELEEERSSLLETFDRSVLEENGATLHSDLSSYGLLRYLSPSYRRLKKRILSHAHTDYSPGYSQLTDDTVSLKRIQTLEKQVEDQQDTINQLGSLYEGADTDWEAIRNYQQWLTAVFNNKLLNDAQTRELLLALPDHQSGDQIDPEIRAEINTAVSKWKAAKKELAGVFDIDAVRISGDRLNNAELAGIQEWANTKREALDQLQEWIQYRAEKDELADTPLETFVSNYISSGHSASELVDTFKRNFYTDWLNAVYADTGLSSFSATEFDSLLDDFRRLDQQQREHAKAAIQHRVTNRRPTIELEHASSSAQVTLRREIQKSRRHMPLRQLFDETASLVTDLKPVFMMSPLSVAQYLEYDSISFDTVIFDEASQIMPQDAISSLIRGEQIIIAGDSKQLPPTSFFQADVDAGEGVREDLESILDEAATVLPEKRLLWHYRSRTNELIEFSNTKYYNGALQTFPDNETDSRMGVEFDYVEDGLYDRGGSSTNEPEAERVVELIREHIDERSSKSLGVVAFSSKQADAIRETIERERETDRELDAFVSEDDALEGFFVKSLENVQGDERDALIFSVGYGPDSAGKIAMNFGPLNQSGGERRLNVAVTRAKELVQVVTSIQPGDIDLGRTGATGVEDFKHYLEYAKRGEEALTRSDSESQFLHFDSEFEEAVYTALESRGFDVTTQVESSGYSIDLAIKHPDNPGKYVLGIECDGAAYHSSKTARDRDRTRQMVLEDLGWTIHRIWSPDWASNKEAEIADIEARVDNLVGETMSADGGISTYDPDPVEVDPIPESERSGLAEYVSAWEEPDAGRARDRDFDDIPKRKIGRVLERVVERFGPLSAEMAYRTTIRRWKISRLGKNIRKTLENRQRRLRRKGKLQAENGFLWPGDRPETIPIRNHPNTETRDIEEIPLQELARAAHLLLTAGKGMNREDLVLEVARQFGYQRRGPRIKDRIHDAIDHLIDLGGATETVVGEKSVLQPEDVDIDQKLLNTVYN
jgi:very-short-patch-repair endonuclease